MNFLNRELDALHFLVAISILLLVSSLLLKLPYGFFSFLRLWVCVTAVVGSVRWFQIRKSYLMPMTVLVILFNPIVRIALRRELWSVVDLLTALYFTLSLIVSFRHRTKYRKANSARREISLDYRRDDKE